METIGPSSSPGSFKLSRLAIVGIAVVSAVYFADIFLKASRKCFWFDELFTFYLCRLPSFGNTWTAVTHGADFNPPLFYLLTRAAQRFFGDGLIATRLPSTIGVWLFCICLFLFVGRRTGWVPGFVAGAFPFFTLVQYYAYEARAHGIVLGWCGLALVCWQRCLEPRAKHLWLVGFGVSLLGGLLTHVYALYLLVPFSMVELYSLLHKERARWDIIAILALAPACVIFAVYLPLFREYRASTPASFFPASHDLIQRFLVNAIGPAMIILILWLLLSVRDEGRNGGQSNTSATIPRREILVALGFACIPILGLIGCKLTHGPFLDRYFLSSIAGYAIFLGFSCSRWEKGSVAPKLLAGCMFLIMVADLGSTIYLDTKERMVLLEPSSGFNLTTTPTYPMKLYDTLLQNDRGLDILVLPELSYLYFFRYAPPSTISHLYFGAPAGNLFLMAYEKLAKWADIDLKTTTFDPFLAAHEHFLAYGNGSSDLDATQAIARAGYRLVSARADAGGIMYEYEKAKLMLR
jgi:hypothetical protein